MADAAKSVRTYLLILMCGLLLVSGFFFAAQQHFSSMDYGMKNSRLRKQVDDLEAEKRRLLLAREISMSPAEVKKAAKRAGLFGESPDAQPSVQVTSTRPALAESNVPPPAESSNPLVTKTVSVAPAARPVLATFQNAVKAAATEKRTSVEKKIAGEKRNRAAE